MPLPSDRRQFLATTALGGLGLLGKLPAVTADLGHSSEATRPLTQTVRTTPRSDSGKNPHRRRASNPCRRHCSQFHPAFLPAPNSAR